MMVFLIGLGLGLLFSLLGAGGAILAVPALLLFSGSMQEATGGGLAVVWAAALFGAIAHARAGRVAIRIVFAFGLPSMAGAALGALVHPLVSERVIMVIFALVVIGAVVALLRPKRHAEQGEAAVPALIAAGLVTGALTGFLGVGGGFLIVPALTIWARLPLHRAVGTSMAIITLASFSGALVHLLAGHVSWRLALPMGAGAVVGALVGAPLAGRIPDKPLRVAFAVIALAVAGWMVIGAFRHPIG